MWEGAQVLYYIVMTKMKRFGAQCIIKFKNNGKVFVSLIPSEG